MIYNISTMLDRDFLLKINKEKNTDEKEIKSSFPSEEELVRQGLEQESRVIELRKNRKNIKKFEENNERKAS